jgi:hypothetical protein
MQRFLAKLRAFFLSRGFLIFVIGMVVLVMLVYAEEDWRGARAWAATKAEWEAKGESFDRAKFVPPPVPDEQNIAALPLFKLENVSTQNGPPYLTAVTLRHAMRDDLPQFYFPKMGNPITGERLDMVALRKTMAANYALAFRAAKPPDDLLAQFDAIFPFFNEFVSAAQGRPSLRLNGDYLMPLPAARPLGPLVDLIKLAKISALHATLAQDQHRSDLALADIGTNLKLARGASRDPSMVGGLVAIGIVAINRAAIYNGLSLHAWNDAQLIELESILKPLNFLAGYQFSMRAEAVDGITMMDFLRQTNQAELGSLLGRGVRENPVMVLVGVPWPSGWWDDNKQLVALFDLNGVGTVDVKAQLVFPRIADQLENNSLQATAAWDGEAAWKILGLISTGALTNSIHKFAEGQVSVDETRIACALERYRLAHGVYPAALEALVPACIEALPHDIMNGEPYHYGLRPDGTFLLYSVGWNQTDDGGTVAFMKENPKSIDYENGDWVWPTPK